MTAHGASSSSSKSKLWNYDVFLSFRGEDTRNGFTGHLHAALTDRGYQPYMDEDDLQRGEEIKGELFRAIEESRICIIVFSKRYADSSWCLDELVKIMECRDKLGRHVLPIFYHIDPSHVRKQDGDLAEAFQKHEKDIREEKDDKKREAKQERVMQWREALKEAADLSGHTLKSSNNRKQDGEGIGEEEDDKKERKKQRREALTEAANFSEHQTTDNGRDAEFIKKIVEENICEWLTSTNELHVAKHPVGIDSRIQDIVTYLLSGGSNDVVMVGIWGMGGLGKTTAAKAIYNQIQHMFQFKSFLDDVSDITSTSKDGLVRLQRTLVSDILTETESQKIRNVAEGINLIKQHLRRRRVLVIMDNIDQVEQLDAIAENHDGFGPGSRIIITTRDEHLLKQVEVDKIYPVQKLNKGEALELFSWHAFRNSCPDERYRQLSEQFVSYCDGLPLALEVVGSFLIKRTIAEWKCQLEKLKRIPEGKIIKPLRISFEGLDDTKKAIFLDISCFFIGRRKNYVAKILDACDFFATIGISVLRERCLVTVECNELKMHDLLREMARVIISEKSPGHPGKWSRLWNLQEITDVLTNKSGTEEVEGLALDFPDPRRKQTSSQSSNKSSLSTEAFANMKKLRLLQLNYAQLHGEYKHLPKELIWLCWQGFPLQTIPNDFFNQPRLVILEMRYSKMVQIWEGSKSLQKLKIINLSESRFLTKSPDFSQVPNLEELILERCESLSEIHPSIGHLKRLSLVNLRSCRKLTSLPRDFYKSKSVEILYLNGCSKFVELHEDLGEMISLRILEVEHTSIRQVQPSIVGLKNLFRLSLRGLENNHLPYSLHGLNSLNLSGCNLTDDAIPKDLGILSSLQHFDLGGNNFHTLTSLSGLLKLETLLLSGCFNLHTIPKLPTNLKFLCAFHCPALEKMPNFSEMSNMRKLDVMSSPKLTAVPGLDKSLNSMSWIDMRRCTNLTADFSKNILQGWTSCGVGGIFLHGNYVPDWFEFVNEGTKVSFDIPPSDDRNFEGLTLFCLYRAYSDYYISPYLGITVINNVKRTELRIRMKGNMNQICGDDFLWQGQLSNNKLNFQGGDKIKIKIIFVNPLEVVDNGYAYSITTKRIGVNLVWDKPMKENNLENARYVLDRHPARFYGGASSSSSHI